MECESHFEELVRSADQAVTCPECGAAKVLKQLSTFAVHGAQKQPSYARRRPVRAAAAAAAPAAAATRARQASPLRRAFAAHPDRAVNWRSDGCRRTRSGPPGVRGRDGVVHEVRARRGADAGRLRLGQPERRPDVRRRGAGLPRGPAGRPVRRPGREAARQAARRDRAHAGGRLRGERAQVPASREPRPDAGGDRGLRAASLPPDRADRAEARRDARELRDEAPLRQAGRASRACTGTSRR